MAVSVDVPNRSCKFQLEQIQASGWRQNERHALELLSVPRVAGSYGADLSCWFSQCCRCVTCLRLTGTETLVDSVHGSPIHWSDRTAPCPPCPCLRVEQLFCAFGTLKSGCGRALSAPSRQKTSTTPTVVWVMKCSACCCFGAKVLLRSLMAPFVTPPMSSAHQMHGYLLLELATHS